VIAIMWSAWGLAVDPLLRKAIIAVSEVFNWGLFALLAMLLAATLPGWVYEAVELIVPKRRQRVAVA
jgi:hypothetical protein